MGRYMHGCGEKIRVHFDGGLSAEDNYPCGWRTERPCCPRCNRPIWISDLGPIVDLSKIAAPPTDHYVEAHLF